MCMKASIRRDSYEHREGRVTPPTSLAPFLKPYPWKTAPSHLPMSLRGVSAAVQCYVDFAIDCAGLIVAVESGVDNGINGGAGR